MIIFMLQTLSSDVWRQKLRLPYMKLKNRNFSVDTKNRDQTKPPETSRPTWNHPKRVRNGPFRSETTRNQRNHPKPPDLGSFALFRVVSLVLGGFGWFRLVPLFSKVSGWFRVVSSFSLAKFNFEAKITRNHSKPPETT